MEVITYRFTYALRGSKPICSYLHVTCGLRISLIVQSAMSLLPVLIRGQLVPNAERATPRFSKAARVATVLQLVSNVSVFAVKQPYI